MQYLELYASLYTVTFFIFADSLKPGVCLVLVPGIIASAGAGCRKGEKPISKTGLRKNRSHEPRRYENEIPYVGVSSRFPRVLLFEKISRPGNTYLPIGKFSYRAPLCNTAMSNDASITRRSWLLQVLCRCMIQ